MLTSVLIISKTLATLSITQSQSTVAMGRLLVPLSLLVLATAAVYGIPAKSTIPSVGSVWGPILSNVEIRDSKGNIVQDDEVLLFFDPMEMYQYAQSVVTNDSVVLSTDLAALEGKYVEVLSSKIISPDAIKLVCHNDKQSSSMCHGKWPYLPFDTFKSKVIYSMVKNMDDGTIFPLLFISHQSCEQCSWVTHINELTVLEKSII